MFLRSNTFTSSGSTLLAPYNTVHKFAAIVLDDVERVVIGDSSLDASVQQNVFENSNFGIRASKSSFELYNNTFRNITELDGEILEIDGKGSCVYSNSASDFNERSMIVGNKDYYLPPPAESHKNVFHSSVSGIVSRGEMNLMVYNNEFGSIASTDDKIDHSCVGIFQNTGKTIDIGRENYFYDYSHGILLSGFTNQTEINISKNSFYNGYLNTPMRNFDGTAIRLTNALPILRMNNATIADNEIGIWDEVNSDYYQPRIGIHIANTGGVKIEENEIRFNLNVVPVDLYRGIRLEGSPECLIRGNSIDNHLTGGLPGFNGMLTGVRVDVSPFADIKCNTITNVGYCMDFQGENSYVPMADNSMYSYNLGINLGFLSGSTTFPTNIGWQQGNPSTGFGNTWNDPSTDRAEGFLTQTSPIPWYHHDSENFANDECPMPSSGIPNFTIIPRGNRTGYLEFPCNIDDPISMQARALAFCDIIADTVRYENPNAEDIHYARQNAMFRFLKTDTARIYSGEEEDDAYLDYFNELSVTNLGKYYSVMEYTNDGKPDLALELIQTIEDTCVQEEYLKTALIIELNSLATNEAYSAEDSSVLREIAYVNSLNGGLATKLARAMLQVEVEDAGSGGSRLMKKPTIENYTYTLHPIPAKDFLILTTNNTASFIYTIYDVVGSKVKTGERNAEPIDITALAPGAYTIIVVPENDKQYSLKFIKLK